MKFFFETIGNFDVIPFSAPPQNPFNTNSVYDNNVQRQFYICNGLVYTTPNAACTYPVNSFGVRDDEIFFQPF